MKNLRPKKIEFALSLCVLSLMMLTGCEESAHDFTNYNFTTQNYPAVDGSTSTEPLQTLIACKLLNVDYSWVYSSFHYKYPYRLMPSCEKKPGICKFITENIYHGSTHISYENLIRKNVDLILVARRTSNDEKHLADSLGVELIETPVALDAFIFLNNINNPVNSITTDQIQDVYTGKITSWLDLGGPNEKINPYLRNRNSGSQELMETLIMKDLQMIEAPDMIMYGMMGLVNQIEYDRQGLGYSVNYYTRYMIRSDSIKLMEIDGVYPDYNSLKMRAYPYTTEVFVVIRKDLDENSMAYKLYDLILSSDGQDIVRESGYIPFY